MLSTVSTFISLLALSTPSISANAHSGRSPGSHSRRAAAACAPEGYSALVAFGASYTDNAHPRDPAWNSSTLRWTYGDAGRFCDGPVAVEYMVKSGVRPALPHEGVRPKLLDYAFGASQIDNSLTSGSVPDTKTQVAAYLKNLTEGTIDVGINPVTQIWTTANTTNRTSQDLAKAKAAVTANAKTVISQMRLIHNSAVIASKEEGADFLIVGIPPMEIVPNLIYAAANNTASLALLKELCDQYNSELKSMAKKLQKEVKHGKVIFFDLAALWYRFHRTPEVFHLTQGDKTCYDSKTGKACTDSSEYLYWDTLHPVTGIQRVVAQSINAAVKKAQ